MSIDTKSADPSIQVDVDELILDYLIFGATKALLTDLTNVLDVGETPADDYSTGRILALAVDFLSIYGALHQDEPIKPELHFRGRLLKFVATLRGWSQRHHLRSAVMHSTHRKKGFDNSEDHAIVNGDRTLPNGSHNVAPRYFSSQSSPTTLLSTLPSFMALSAAQLALQDGDNQITEIWMRLAAEYMLQAAVEYIVVSKSPSMHLIDEAFDWGFDEENTANEDSDEFMVNAMFFDNDAERANESWLATRQNYKSTLQPPSGFSLKDHAIRLLETDLSTSGFEERLLSFLGNLHSALAMPLLAQLESTCTGGMSDVRARALCEMVSMRGN